MRRTAGVVALIVLSVGAGACGSDGDSAEEPDDEETTTAADSGEFCDAAGAYADLIRDVDVSSVDGLLDQFAELATAAEAMADVAPEEIRDGVETLAAVAKGLSEAVIAAAPETMDELNATADAATIELEQEFGELEAEVQQVETYATETCGIDTE